jgi:hypothetical protein
MAGRDQAVAPAGAGAGADGEVRGGRVQAELFDVAGGVEGAADVEAVGGVGAGGGEVLPDPGPHVALAVLVPVVACGLGRAQPPEQAADEHHHLPVGVVVGVGERPFDVLVPPLGPVPHLAVMQQVGLQLGEPGAQVADLHADRVAVQRRLLGCLRAAGRTVLSDIVGGAGGPLEDVVGGAVHQHQLHVRGLQRVRDGLVFGRRLGDRGDDAERAPLGGEAVEFGGERLHGNREPAVAQFAEERPEVLTQLQVDDLGLFGP